MIANERTRGVSERRATAAARERRSDPSVGLRKFPYPYVCGLALASDPDDLHTREDFLEVARFLNTTGHTSMGTGLGLETGYGFWAYDGCGTCDFTLFRGTSREPSPNAEVIEDLIRSGHLDYMHTYGDFSDGGFRRGHAAHALEYLARRGLRLEVWVNHGGSGNRQQIGNLSHQRGDDPGAPEYHTDLLLQHGVRFLETYGIVHTVGQDAPCSCTDRLKQTWESFAYGMRGRDWRFRSLFSNSLLERCRLRDGQQVHSFKRFIGPCDGLERAGSRELAVQISSAVIEQLKSKRGYMIVYTHLWRGLEHPCRIPERTRNALRHLADEQRSGNVYVTTTRKLLVYNLLQNGLAWESHADDTGTEIRITGWTDATQDSWAPSCEELQGVTFYTAHPDRTRIYLKDSKIGNVVENPPDSTGRPSLSIAVSRQAFPPQYLASQGCKGTHTQMQDSGD